MVDDGTAVVGDRRQVVEVAYETAEIGPCEDDLQELNLNGSAMGAKCLRVVRQRLVEDEGRPEEGRGSDLRGRVGRLSDQQRRCKSGAWIKTTHIHGLADEDYIGELAVVPARSEEEAFDGLERCAHHLVEQLERHLVQASAMSATVR